MFTFMDGVMYARDAMLNRILPVKVIFNEPATVVFWKDGTKTVVRCQDGETFDKEKGFMAALMKKAYGNSGFYNEFLKEFCGGDDE